MKHTQKRKLSKTSIMHYGKLVVRSVFFLAATVVYIINRLQKTGEPFGGYDKLPWVLGLIWIAYAVEIALRFFPAKIESMGCQKQFAKNYQPTGQSKPRLVSWQRTLVTALAWFALNGAIGLLYALGVIDSGILMLICLAYGVCDMICILFFCPFQTWFLKNRCCTDCRIYNWDFAMMFTPLVFIPDWYTWSLLAMSLLLLIRWEITYRIHPERFSETTNACLSCTHCNEKLCHHKKQLRHFVAREKERIKRETERLKNKFDRK